MPAPTFAALILTVIAAAGVTIGLFYMTDVSLLWASMGGLVLAGFVKSLAKW